MLNIVSSFIKLSFLHGNKPSRIWASLLAEASDPSVEA